MPATLTERAAPRDSGSRAPATSRSGRLLWADAAKGVTIFLVVLNHLVQRHYPELDFGGAVVVRDAWLSAMTVLEPLRMPLFFLLSGFFAASALRRPWAAVVVKRVVRPYYLFAAWLGVHAAFFTFERGLPTTRIDSAGELAGQLLLPSSSLWFLYALALYFAVAYGLLRLSARPPALAGALVMVLAAGAVIGWSDPVVGNLPFFLLGACAPQLLRAFAAGASSRRLLGLAVAYAAALIATHALSIAGQPLVAPLLSLAGIALAVTALVLATAVLPRPAEAIAAVGRRTLPIYVLHLPVLALWQLAVAPTGSTGSGLALALYPLLATAGIVVACHVIHRGLLATGAAWLFDLPDAEGRQAVTMVLSRAGRPRFAA